MITYVKTEGIDFFGCIVLYMFICGSIQNWETTLRKYVIFAINLTRKHHTVFSCEFV